MIKIPKTFFNDHAERDLPTPAIIQETQRNYFISPADPHLPELINDALYYADKHGPNDAPPSLKASAKALFRAIRKHDLEEQMRSLTVIENGDSVTVHVYRSNHQLGWIAKVVDGLRVEANYYDSRSRTHLEGDAQLREIEIFTFGDSPDAAATALCDRLRKSILIIGFLSDDRDGCGRSPTEHVCKRFNLNVKRLDIRGDINKIVTL